MRNVYEIYTLKMEATGSSETFITTYQIIRWHNPEYQNKISAYTIFDTIFEWKTLFWEIGYTVSYPGRSA
jgi:hypothetical protein